MTLAPNAALMQALSSRVLRSLSRDLWHEVFVEREGRDVIFEERLLTLLHADPELPLEQGAAEVMQREFHWLATILSGKLDRSAAPGCLTLFRSVRPALRMAMALQRSTQEIRFRIGVLTTHCTLGIFEAQDRHWVVVIGGAREKAASLAWNAVAGAVALCAPSCRALGSDLSGEVGGALLTQKFQGPELLQATIALT